MKELPDTLLGFETTSPSPPCPFCRAPFAGETGGDLAPVGGGLLSPRLVVGCVVFDSWIVVASI